MAPIQRPLGHVIRKRNAYTRARAKRTRPRAPAPKEGWVIADLARLTGLSVRTLRYYVSQDLLRPLEFRGTATRYPRRELLRLLKMLALKAESRSRVLLSQLKRQLDSLGDPELEAWISSQRLSPELTAALGLDAKGAAATASPVAVHAGFESASLETWRRIELLPGLELMVSSTASPAVQSVARRLHAEYVGSNTSAQ